MSGILSSFFMDYGTLNGPVLAFQTLLSSTTGGGGPKSGVTYTSAPLGPADASRTIIVGTALRENGVETVASVTVAGISATNRGQVYNSGTFVTGMVYWTAAVPTGTTGNIVVSYTASVDSADGCAVWAAYGLSSAVPVATASSFSTTAPALNLNVSDGGLVVAMSWGQSLGTPSTAWTGVTNNAEVVGDPITTQRCNAASAANLSAASPRAVSGIYNGTSSAETCAFAASFR